MRPPREPRERTYHWEAATIGPARLRELSGLELMRLIRDGELPMPAIAHTVGFRLTEAEPGRAVFEGEPEPFVYNMFGAAHGGYAATLLDSAMGCSVSTLVPRGSGYTTVDLTINYVRPVRAGLGTIRAEGRALHVGRRTATAEGRLVSAADGKLLAHGLTTCLVFALRGDAPGVVG